jgi:hypothetical protein
MDSFEFKNSKDFGCRIVASKKSLYGHCFGGENTYEGTIPPGSTQPVHLLFRLSTKDPLMPLVTKGSQWLPVFYAIQFGGSPMAYRVVSDSVIEIIWIQQDTYEPDFPSPNYPRSFPLVPVELIQTSYEELRASVFVSYLARHGLWGKLAANDKQILDGIGGAEISRIGVCHDYLQHKPNVACPNPTCQRGRDGFTMGTFLTIWDEPVKGIDIWDGGGQPVELVYQFCRECGTIMAGSQCD